MLDCTGYEGRDGVGREREGAREIVEQNGRAEIEEEKDREEYRC